MIMIIIIILYCEEKKSYVYINIYFIKNSLDYEDFKVFVSFSFFIFT